MTPKLTEETIKNKFVKAYNEFIVDEDALIEDAILIKNALTNVTKEEEEITKIEADIDIIQGAAEKLVRENQFKVQDQDEYQRKYNEFIKRFEVVKEKISNVTQQKGRKLAQSLKLEYFIENLKQSPQSLISWDESMWNIMLEKGVINRDGTITFKFKNGKEVRI